MKKLLLGLGSIMAIIAPVAGVVACAKKEAPSSTMGIITSYSIKKDYKTITALTIDLTQFGGKGNPKLVEEIDLITHATLTAATDLKIIIDNDNVLEQKIKATAPTDSRIDVKFNPLISLLKIRAAPALPKAPAPKAPAPKAPKTT